MQLSKEDLKMHKTFLGLFDSAKFEIKGDAVDMMASLKNWYRDLGRRMQEHFEPPKEKKEPIKKVK